MYRVDLETGATTLEATDPGDILTWTTYNDFVIRAPAAFNGDIAEMIIRVSDAVDKPWRDLVRRESCKRRSHTLDSCGCL